ncbi:MAG: hypothetical protein AYK19_13395 [Theionarchaea archaeon DG-70-1]|nr:MAG: hypothetical protein AYK19_13395 [Theionarchaea archaeon DG-70-1]
MHFIKGYYYKRISVKICIWMKKVSSWHFRTYNSSRILSNLRNNETIWRICALDKLDETIRLFCPKK